jgi:dihydrofolate reductase|tara:strand:- start:508 stop:954 length:447 start_codon:yes stop_codon:yes gene_type:complete
MKVIGIAAITVDGFIARHSLEKLTWTKDLSLFKKQTLNHTVIMGSNTKKTLSGELEKRHSIVVHRKDNPKAVLDKIKGETCFIIGGGKTFSKFAGHLTHLYLTVHPIIFGKGIKLFEDFDNKMILKFEKQIPVFPDKGIIQLQFSIKH